MPDEQNEGGEATLRTDPFMSSLLGDMGVILTDEEKKLADAPPEPVKAVEEEGAGAQGAEGQGGEPKPGEEGGEAGAQAGEEGGKKDETPPPAHKPVKASVRKQADVGKIVEDAVARGIAAAKKPEAKTDAPPLPDAGKQADDTAGLSKDQLDELADAKHAEQYDPEAFKGMAAKMRAFYTKLDEYVKQHEADSERTFDENDAEFVKFLKANKPSWKGKRDTVRIDRIAEEKAAAKIKQHEEKLAPQINAAAREAREARVRPEIEKAVSEFATDLDGRLAAEGDPLAEKTYSAVKAEAAGLVTTYVRLLSGLDTVGTHNPESVQQQHAYLVNFVKNHADTFAKTATPEQKVRGGKTFVAPEVLLEMRQKNDKNLSKVWTFTREDVIKALADHAEKTAKSAVQAEIARLEGLGFKRDKPAKSGKVQDPPKPTSGPKVAPKASPGAGAGKEGAAARHVGHDIVEELGLV